MIPLLDLKPLNAQWQDELDAAVLRVAQSGRYILDREVAAFEEEWAAYCGVKHCVATGNCLDALRMMLMAHGIGEGCEVIVPANTYIATWLAVTLAGAAPVPVDADPVTRNIDPKAARAAITSRTAAILAVHLYGSVAPMEALHDIALRYGLALFADAAQAHGALDDTQRKAGGFGNAEAFSFYPSKNLGALGDAGCVTTNDAGLAARVRRLRNYGGVGRLDHSVRGINSRMDEMQAAVLRVKLKYLDAENNKRRDRAREYYSIIGWSKASIRMPEFHYGDNYHQFVIAVNQRGQLIRRLAQLGVDAHVHYPVPPHLEPAYADMGLGTGAFPVAERLAQQVLSLPIGNDVNARWIGNLVVSAQSQQEVA